MRVKVKGWFGVVVLAAVFAVPIPMDGVAGVGPGPSFSFAYTSDSDDSHLMALEPLSMLRFGAALALLAAAARRRRNQTRQHA